MSKTCFMGGCVFGGFLLEVGQVFPYPCLEVGASPERGGGRAGELDRQHAMQRTSVGTPGASGDLVSPVLGNQQ